MTITINMPVGVAKAFQAAFFSWKTSLVGVLSVAYGVFEAYSSQDATLSALVHDQKFVMALVVAVLGFLAKDSTAHGTPSNPIPPPIPPPPAPQPAPMQTVGV